MRERVLVRRWESADGATRRRQVILPRAMIGEVFREAHASLTGGHFGLTKTLGRIGMAADLRSHLRQCDVCARRKCPSKTLRAPLQQRIRGSPMERVALDVVGPFPRTRMARVHEEVRTKLGLVCRRQKQYYERRAITVKFEVGQYVWLRLKMRQRGKSPKLQTRTWLGPYLVVTKLSDVTMGAFMLNF